MNEKRELSAGRKKGEQGETKPGNPANPRRRGRITGATNARRAPLSASEARSAEQAEIERLMTNWARWKSGAPIGVAVSMAYDLEAPGRREARSAPLLNGEAADVDGAVAALPPELYDVVTIHWLGKRRDEMSRRAHPPQQRSLPDKFITQTSKMGEHTFTRTMRVGSHVQRHELDAPDQALAKKLEGRVVAHIAHAPLERVNVTTVAQRARAAGCGERTYYRRLDHAHSRILLLMRAKKRDGERARDQYRKDVRNLDKVPAKP